MVVCDELKELRFQTEEADGVLSIGENCLFEMYLGECIYIIHGVSHIRIREVRKSKIIYKKMKCKLIE